MSELSDEEFRKFIRYFTTRLVQTLVQARLGEPINQKCTVNSHQNDWFNIHVDEVGEISAYMKSTMKRYPPDVRLGVEFLLYTAEGKYLPLEAWIISVLPDKEPAVDIRTDLYYHMSTLLRSASVAARMTPMHRLYVKNQSEDSFIIMYRILEVKSAFDMGDNSKERRLGRLPSPYGTLCLDVVYRTVMKIDSSTTALSTNQENEINDVLVKRAKDDRKSESPLSEKLFPLQSQQSPMSISKSNSSEEPAATFQIGKSTSSEEFSQSNDATTVNVIECRPFMAELRNNSFPFARLLHSAYSELEIAPLNEKLEVTEEEKEVEEETKGETENQEKEETEEEKRDMTVSEDSFVKICDFGSESCPRNDVAELIKQLRTAPENLKTCSETFSSFDEIKEELRNLNNQCPNFDKFVEQVTQMSKED